tara:strand:- start:4484 stop:5416 length:933 start_codon:yes stop_codon:yes gene_type:complete
MKSDLDHLPPQKQWELDHIKDVVFAEFDKAMGAHRLTAESADWRRHGRIQWIILFGSYARGDWVDEPQTTKGYKSDYDLLIIVSHKEILELTNLWFEIDEHLMRDKRIKTPVTFILETRDSINSALAQGQYFFNDIRKQGVALHQLPNARLKEPAPLTTQEAYDKAQEYFDIWLKNAKTSMKVARFCVSEGDLNEAAFNFHQATERIYNALLLTLTSYCPPTHNLKALRSLSEDLDRSLVDIWPRAGRRDQAAFNKLVNAYVKARYSKHYVITAEELHWLDARITPLHDQIETLCRSHLSALAKKAGAAG